MAISCLVLLQGRVRNLSHVSTRLFLDTRHGLLSGNPEYAGAAEFVSAFCTICSNSYPDRRTFIRGRRMDTPEAQWAFQQRSTSADRVKSLQLQAGTRLLERRLWTRNGCPASTSSEVVRIGWRTDTCGESRADGYRDEMDDPREGWVCRRSEKRSRIHLKRRICGHAQLL